MSRPARPAGPRRALARAAAFAATPLALLALTASTPLAAQLTQFIGTGLEWTDVENWNNGLPDVDYDVVLGTGLTSRLDDNFTVNHLELQTSHSLELTLGKWVVVTGGDGVRVSDATSINDFGATGAGIETTQWQGNGHSLFSATLRAGENSDGDRALDVAQLDTGTQTHRGTWDLSSTGYAFVNLRAFSANGAGTGELRIESRIIDSGGANQTTNINIHDGGRVVFAGNNTYSGTTSVRGGLTMIPGGAWLSGGLVIEGDPYNDAVSATGSSNVEVANRGSDYGVLSGQGRIGGTLYLHGALLPGNHDGLDIGTVTIGGSFIAGPDPIGGGTGSILLDIDPLNTQGQGTVDLIRLTSPTAFVDLSDLGLAIFLKSLPTNGQIFRFIDAPESVTITGTFRDWATSGTVNTVDFEGSTVSFQILYGTSFVELVAVPEPATYALWLALVTVALVLWRHRRELRDRRSR